MNSSFSFRKNFIWMFIGSMVASGCQWIVLMVLAKLLSPEDVGYYALGLAITAPVVLFSMLQLRAILVTDAKSLHGFEDYLGLRIVTNLLAGIIVLGIMVFLKGRYSIGVYAVIALILVNKVVEATSDICYGLMQKHERLDKVAKSLILRNLFGTLLFAVVIKLTSNLILGTFAIGIWWLVVLLVYDRRNVELYCHFKPRFDRKAILSIFILGLPLGIAIGIMSLNSNMSRYFVEAYLGSESLGFFAAMAYVVIGVTRAIMALGHSGSARLAQYFCYNRKAYIKLLSKMMAVVFCLAIATVLFGKYFGKTFLTIVYKPEYAEKQDVFFLLLVSAGIAMLASMLGYGMTATRSFKSQVPLCAIICSVTFVLSWMLMPKYGMKGAAWALLIASIVQCLGSVAVIIFAWKSVIVLNDDGSQRADIDCQLSN